MLRLSALIGSVLLLATGALCAETFGLVQITDMRGQTGYEIMNREEYATLTQDIRAEAAVYASAVAECRKEWETNKENTVSFPANRIKPRSVKKIGSDFNNREKADAKKARLEERQNEKQMEELQKESQSKKMMDEKAVEREVARVTAYENALIMISKRMSDKLGRPIPTFGLNLTEPPKAAGH
jgi:alanyl-tRNA synthetase